MKLPRLARKFHTLLAGGATECSANRHTVEGRRDFQAYVKTAWRFCFSPHELTAPVKTPRHRASGRREDQSECEKCGLGLALIIAWLATFAAASTSAASAASDAARIYELRTYTATPGNLAAVVARFRDHTVKLFEKHGMVNVGYWVPADEKDGSADKLIYLLAHQSREAAAASWKSFMADPEWQAVQKRTEAGGKIVAKAERLYLTATDFSKAMTAGNGQGATRVFELRTYTAAEGKLGALDARFRDHTIALFPQHGITNLGYFHPADADKGAATTLIYFIAHADRAAAAASWKSFRDDPRWVKARTESEKNGKLTSKVESVYLNPVDFSKIK